MSLAVEEATSLPLVVDLDGTFLNTDLMWESVLAALKSDPRRLLAAVVSLGHGRAAFKARLIDMAALDVERLPVEAAVLEFIQQQKSAGRRIVLATGSTSDAARALARCYPLFDEVMTTDGAVNLVGRHKGLELEKRFGKGQFDYVGNALADLDVWSRCHTAYLCNSHGWTRWLLARRHPRWVPLATGRSGRFAALARGARVHQWAKNLLILAPFLAAHQPLTLAAALQLALGVLAFSLTSSAVYLINDLVDVEHDRRHPAKQHRPLASGHLSIPAAIGGVALLVASVWLLVQRLPAPFTLLLVGYFVATCLYSFWLKRVVLADVIVLAGLYVWRVGAGSALMDVPLSRWFMVFSVFLFFSLALVKRCSELAGAKTRGVEQAHGRGYWVKDLLPLSQFGAISGLIAALVYCLYIASPEVSRLYSRPEVLWLGLPVLLFWICRLWLLASRGEVQEDPLVFALNDRVSYAVGATMGIVILVAA